jgi:antitoxin VapB
MELGSSRSREQISFFVLRLRPFPNHLLACQCALMAPALASAVNRKDRIIMTERHVKLFKNGRNQVVRIPRDFELPGEDAIIRKDGQRLILEPAPPRSLLAILAPLPTLDEEFPPIEDRPAEPVDL